MNIIIFLIILALLVLVHEFGHFIVAKKNGVRVDEFGLGFPPRIFGKKIGETVYSINAVPFGGFVRIFGENAESLESPDGVIEDSSRSLAHKNKLVQAAVLVAGVSFNMIFAWLVISFGLVSGLPTAVDATNISQVKDVRLVISSVLPKSPAEKSGIKAGDILLSLKTDKTFLVENVNPETVQELISTSQGEIIISYKHGTEVLESKVEAKEGIVNGGRAIGISMDMVGIMNLPIGQALVEGSLITGRMFKNITVGIFNFFGDAILGRADLSSVAGPVGMVTLVGDARDLGFAYLIFFTALLSINLAVINLLPFPALDGGRLVMVAIEAIKGSPLKPKIVQTVNALGFGLLIFLMIVVTYHDILKLF
ncbi:MAG: site-2 protease family protein [bacterium]|nr:site-2 protease family protein [bacterium]